jgi:hypothetical protein
MQIIALILLISTLLPAARADERRLRPASKPLPEYIAHRTTDAMVIDGQLDERAWKSAPVVSFEFPWKEQTGPRQGTRVRLLWDAANLYFSFDCRDQEVTTRHEQRDDPTYEDDAVEIFLNPFTDRTEYIGLEINARGVLNDYLYVHPHKLYANYDLKGILLASKTHDATNPGWVIEGAIPLVNFVNKWDHAPVQHGTVWMMNLSRWDGVLPNRVLSIWSDSGLESPNPHSPQRFGRLRFASTLEMAPDMKSSGLPKSPSRSRDP